LKRYRLLFGDGSICKDAGMGILMEEGTVVLKTAENL
jgi:hypothetical protein